MPEYQAGEVCPDAPALYLVSGTLPLDRRQNWRRDGDQQEARMMAYEQSGWNLGYLFFTDRKDGTTCMTQNTFNGTCKFEDAMRLCGYTRIEATVRRYNKPSPWLP